jgi:hypothetical protein
MVTQPLFSVPPPSHGPPYIGFQPAVPKRETVTGHTPFGFVFRDKLTDTADRSLQGFVKSSCAKNCIKSQNAAGHCVFTFTTSGALGEFLTKILFTEGDYQLHLHRGRVIFTMRLVPNEAMADGNDSFDAQRSRDHFIEEIDCPYANLDCELQKLRSCQRVFRVDAGPTGAKIKVISSTAETGPTPTHSAEPAAE